MASRILPQLVPLGKTGVLVLHGFGIKCRLDQGHFCAEWGAGFERFQVRLSRVEGRKLRRVILISSDGYISLEALRFITDVGATFAMLDRRGKLNLVCSPTAPPDSRLRRCQSLALGNGTALRISRWLIDQKLASQAALVRDMLHSDTSMAIDMFREELPDAESISSVRLIESQAARCYWQAWANVPIRWPRKDERRVSHAWKVFGSRDSALTHSPRHACSPGNACLNLLYGILEGECRIAAIAMGMDPDIGMLHVDTPNRSSLACDLQEPIRASVDAFLLNWLQSEPLHRSDFWEDRDGNCRLMTPLVLKLCQTADTWRKLVAPIAERVAQELWASRATKGERMLLATRLTQSHKREAKGSPMPLPSIHSPKPDRLCRGCGKRLTRGKSHCSRCAVASATERMAGIAQLGRTVAHTPEARAKEGKKQRQHALERSAWDASQQPAWLTKAFYAGTIKPRLARLSNSTIASAIGVSRWYAGRIREGYRPHPRHWEALARLVGV